MKRKVIYRQGDVLLAKVASLPNGVTDITPPDRIVLAHGEVTGHAHTVKVQEGKTIPARYFDLKAERFLQVLEKTALMHEEHSAVVLDRGVYKQAFQIEEKREEIRRVAD
ncbi:MAG: hypothetical protein A2199_13635 [Hydrogenophilales bacterium RIFOXYA1_FULL_63_33]|nr:MAG: hypothetical protein A2199_13635 [Hydrogenophilales bacterium RIFOXYA1_FULL_63_33]